MPYSAKSDWRQLVQATWLPLELPQREYLTSWSSLANNSYNCVYSASLGRFSWDASGWRRTPWLRAKGRCLRPAWRRSGGSGAWLVGHWAASYLKKRCLRLSAQSSFGYACWLGLDCVARCLKELGRLGLLKAELLTHVRICWNLLPCRGDALLSWHQPI